jgi:hypothetical protein
LAQYGFAAVFATLNTASSKTTASKFSLSLNMASSKFDCAQYGSTDVFAKLKTNLPQVSLRSQWLSRGFRCAQIRLRQNLRCAKYDFAEGLSSLKKASPKL